MRKKNLLITFGTILIGTIVLFIVKQFEFAYMASVFLFIVGTVLIATYIMELMYNKKLDKKYKVLSLENLQKEFYKIKGLKEENKIKAFCFMHIVFKENYDEKTIENVGKYLKTKFPIDPIGFDDGLVVIIINMHEIMMNEMIKIIKNELKEKAENLKHNIKVVYHSNETTYEEMMNALRGK